MMGAFPVDLAGHGDGLADPCQHRYESVVIPPV